MDLLPFSTLGGLAAVVLGFGFIIFVHELGHFLVAKYVGIKCPQFAIGMGNAIVSFRKGIGYRRGSTEAEYMKMMEDWIAAQEPAAAEGEEKNQRKYTVADYDRAAAALGLSETEYRLNWLPLGGYVKMLGQEDSDPSARSEDPRSFTSKSIGARAAVLSAGVIMNIIFGVLFFMIAFMAGVDFNAPVVGSTSPGSPASEAYAVGHEGDEKYKGLRTDDEIIEYAAAPTVDMTDVLINTALAPAGEKLNAKIQRKNPDGSVETLTYPLLPVMSPSGLLDVGINIPVTLNVHPDAKAEDIALDFENARVPKEQAATVKPGMKLIAAGGQTVETYGQYESAVLAGNGAPVELIFEHPKTKERTTIQLRAEGDLNYRKVSASEEVPHLAGFVPATSIKFVAPRSPALKAGVLKGDLVVQVGSTKWPGNREIAREVKAASGAAVKLIVLRDGEEKTFDIKPEDDRLGIGMEAFHPYIVDPVAGTPAEKLNLPPGTRITAINGNSVASFTDIQRILASMAKDNPKGFEVALDCEPNEGKTIEPLKVTAAIDEATATELLEARWVLPLTWRVFKEKMVTVKGTGPGDSIALGIKKAQQSMQQVYITLLRVSQGSVHPRNFQGPVGIAHTGTKIAKKGWTYLMFFLGLISVNLAVVNFLPIPVVDGGHILFLIIEKIKGSPVGPRVQNAALFTGLALIACMFLYVTYNDIVRFIKDVVG